MRSSNVQRLLICLSLLSLAGCATRPVNPKITQVDPSAGYRFETRQLLKQDKDNLVILAFSGGGTRAAAFSYGVLEFLRRTEMVGPKGNRARLLDQVDVITGVSGGSFTALAYGLYGEKLFDEYEKRFLKRNIQGEIIAGVLNPLNWPSLWSLAWGRSEQAAKLYDKVLFNGATTGTITQAVPHVIAELSEWLAAHPEDRPRVEDRQFLRRAVIEGIRLHPASPYLIRQATAGKQLRSGRRLVAGEYVVLDLVKSSRDAAVFAPDPDRFDPHRVPKVRIRPMGLTFGDGPHTCIGMSMTIGDGGAADEDAPLGFAVYLVREFYRAGIYVDPADPPRWNDANVRNEYAAFPVRFDNLAR